MQQTFLEQESNWQGDNCKHLHFIKFIVNNKF